MSELATSGNVAAIDYIYAAYISSWVDDETGDHDRAVIPLRVIKRTAKRVYYARHERFRHTAKPTGYFDRLAFERDGEIRTRHYWSEDRHLFASKAAAEDYVFPPAATGPDLRELRMAMADAHPDRGGTREGFEAARARYLRARSGVLTTAAR
jgi:hypothetical protein